MGRCRPVKTFASDIGVFRGSVMEDRVIDAIASGEYDIVLASVEGDRPAAGAAVSSMTSIKHGIQVLSTADERCSECIEQCGNRLGRA
ncbi:hypothetical protein GCM10023159_14920 [Brevibacterium yomogidense]